MRTDGSGMQAVRVLLGRGGSSPAARGVAARRLARSWKWGGLGLVFLCLAVYVPGLFSIPPVDRDESRFAMASWQMYTSGDWVVPRIQEKARLNKPPLIYWLQAGAWALLGSEKWENGGIWVFRLPSVAAAIATVLLTWRLGLRMFDPRAAWLGAALLAVCPMVVWDAHQARADQVLLTTVAGTQFALWTIWSARNDTERAGFVAPLLFWICLALGIMTKGPITPMIAALTALSLSLVSREWRWLARLRPIMGIAIAVLLVGPWVYLVAQRVGWSEYLSIVYDETLGRSAGAKEGHWGPPGYHTVLLGVLFWPGSLMTAMAIGRAVRRGLRRNPDREGGAAAAGRTPSGPTRRSPLPDGRGSDGGWLVRRLRALGGLRGARPAELFCLAWAVPSWVVFELVSTKLPHYAMPMYPAIALLSARAVYAATQPVPGAIRGLPERIGAAIWLGIGIVLSLALSGVVFFSHLGGHWWSRPPLWAALLPCCALGAAFVACTGPIVRRQVAGIVCAVLLQVSLLQLVLPHLHDIWISPRIAGILGSSGANTRPIAAVRYHEDSLVFLTRGRVEKIAEEQVEAWWKEHPNGVMIAPVELTAESARRKVAHIVHGFNYSSGKWLDLAVAEGVQ